MSRLVPSLFLISLFFIVALNAGDITGSRCRNQPGDPGFPTSHALQQLNVSIEGRLLTVVPTGKFCQEKGGCTDAMWFNTAFRQRIPGAMLSPNWEQDYSANPPSICFRNTPDCGQGLVPILAVNATDVAHIQAGVRFASQYNLRVSIKSSGHDFLGRSTAKNSLLLWMHNFQNITFHDEIIIGGVNHGSAVTVGSGVDFERIYSAAKKEGKIVVGGSTQSVSQSGGYVQGGGHSILSPTFGLASDNVLAVEIITPNGELITASEHSHPELFWAIRGGGAGSWGVIISTTLRTFPAFDASYTITRLIANSTSAVAELMTIHASHIFDWDYMNLGHYFYINRMPSSPVTYEFLFKVLWSNMTSEPAVKSLLAPFLEDAAKVAQFVETSFVAGLVNDVIPMSISITGIDVVLASRLIPEEVYRVNVSVVGEAYKALLDMGSLGLLGHTVGGGQVSKNAKISSAVNPKWRTAKTHIISMAVWADDTSIAKISTIHSNLANNQIPVLDALAGGFESGSYSNEADIQEPHFQVKFFGIENYPRLLEVKAAYDPFDLFIVSAGVGSERWDKYGMCRVYCYWDEDSCKGPTQGPQSFLGSTKDANLYWL